MYRAKVTSADYLMGQVIGLSRSRGARRGPRATFTSPDPLVHADRDETVAHHDVMKELAQRTGGRAFYARNDVERAIREAIGDGERNYTLGYYPADQTDDGKFKKLQVRLGKQGWSAADREGYFADQSKPIRDQRQREAMWELMNGPIELSAIPMAAQWNSEVSAEKPVLKLMMRFDTSALTLREERGQRLGELEIVLLLQDATGVGKGGAEQTVPLRFSPEDHSKAMAAGLNYQMAMPQVAGAVRLMIGVRDVPSGRVGTLKLSLAQSN